MPKTTNATAASVGDSFHDGRDCVVQAQNFAYNDEEDEDDSVLRPRRAVRASAREERVKSVAMFAARALRVCGERRANSRRRGYRTCGASSRALCFERDQTRINKTPVRSASGSSP